MKNNRVRNLSTRWLIPFKVTLLIIYSVLFALILSLEQSGWFFKLYTILFYGYGLYRLLKMTANIRNVEFDEEYLYVIKKNQDVMIPLENIKSVEISTLGGVYKINLYTAEQFGDHFYFKPSLLYPLNFKSKDLLVNVLRKNIEHAKKHRTLAGSSNLLHSMHL